uniref:Uncharacterized protein n=1 Tax=Pararge aegeria TaxID=116150 RepID=S4P220_9NEOP
MNYLGSVKRIHVILYTPQGCKLSICKSISKYSMPDISKYQDIYLKTNRLLRIYNISGDVDKFGFYVCKRKHPFILHVAY